MIKTIWFRKMICGLALVSITTTTCESVLAGNTPGPVPLKQADVKVRDVRLSADGTFSLQLVDSQGNGIKDVPVQLNYDGRKIAEGRSDETGRLQFTGLRPGLHALTAGVGVEAIRLWAADAAPSTAVERLAVVSEERIVRGQPGSPLVPTTGTYSFGGIPFSPFTIGTIAFGVITSVRIYDLEDDIDALQSASP